MMMAMEGLAMRCFDADLVLLVVAQDETVFRHRKVLVVEFVYLLSEFRC
jgi:hypothetical protein